MWRAKFDADGTTRELQQEAGFDELVLDKWLHVEEMSATEWWLRVGDARIFVVVDASGKAKEVRIERDIYE